MYTASDNAWAWGRWVAREQRRERIDHLFKLRVVRFFEYLVVVMMLVEIE